MSDSGGIQEEAPSFNKYVIVMRNFTERIESVQKGYSFLVGTEVEKIVETTSFLLETNHARDDFLNPYGDGYASKKIIGILGRLHQEKAL